MEGLDALYAAAAARSNADSDSDKEIPLNDDSSKPQIGRKKAPPPSPGTISILSEGTEPPVIVNWNIPKKPDILDPIKPKGKKSSDFRAVYSCTSEACIENGKLAVEKCALGKKQE